MIKLFLIFVVLIHSALLATAAPATSCKLVHTKDLGKAIKYETLASDYLTEKVPSSGFTKQWNSDLSTIASSTRRQKATVEEWALATLESGTPQIEFSSSLKASPEYKRASDGKGLSVQKLIKIVESQGLADLKLENVFDKLVAKLQKLDNSKKLDGESLSEVLGPVLKEISSVLGDTAAKIRAMRLVATFVSTAHDFPMPFLTEQNLLHKKADEFAGAILEGMAVTEAWTRDMVWRTTEDFTPFESPVLIAANLPLTVKLNPKHRLFQNKKFDIDMYDFLQFARMTDLKGKTQDQIYAAYLEHMAKWSGFFPSRPEPYTVKLIPDEFRASFQDISAGNPVAWKARAKIFFGRDNVYRGSSYNRNFTDAELVNHFTSFQGLMLSMRSDASENPVRIKKSLQKDFDQYNDALFEPQKLFDAMHAHMTESDGYYSSPFLSTSLDYKVADRFGRGFMRKPERLKNMEGTMVIGAFRPKFGQIDLNMMAQIDANHGIQFTTKYWRQQEVQVVGAIHPDATNFLEFRNVEVKKITENMGQAIAEINVVTRRVLTRDEENPSLINLVEYDGNDKVIRKTIFRIENTRTGIKVVIESNEIKEPKEK
ncbi:MAG: hypothetical protein AB7H97_00305 [Pseudobdellovibrionaceae bacterium]